MYMSGRALYPVTMRLYDRLLHEFDGDLHVSYSAGADAVNVADILACGALPVTGCTDLLKPGGVARMATVARAPSRRRCGARGARRWPSSRAIGCRACARQPTPPPGIPRYRKGAFPARPAEGGVAARPVGLRRRAVRGGVRRRAGRAGVRVAHRAGRLRPRARDDPGAQPAARRDRLRVHAAVPDALHAQRLRGERRDSRAQAARRGARPRRRPVARGARRPGARSPSSAAARPDWRRPRSSR